MDLNVRLHELRKSMKLTQTDFGKRIGIKQNTIGQMESGKRTLTDRTIMAICKEFNINEVWFRTGEGEMYNQTTQSQLDALSVELNLDNVCQSILTAYSKMDENQQKTIDSFLNEFVTEALKNSSNSSNDTSNDFDIDNELAEYRKELEIEKIAKKLKIVKCKNMRVSV